MIFYRALRRLELWAALFALVVVLLLVGWATLTRYLGVPNVWVIEVTQGVFAWVCLLAASIAFRSGSHFSVDLVGDMLPDAMREWLGVLRYCLLLIILVVLVWISLDTVEIAHRRRLPLTGIRFSWVVAAFPTACILMILTCIEQIVRQWPGQSGPDALASKGSK